MSKRTTILLHIAIWFVVFLSPMSFVVYESNVTFRMVLLIGLAPLTTMLVFYANYLWLTPAYFVSGEKRKYWTVNIILVVALGLLTHYWFSYLHVLFDDARPHPEPTAIGELVFILRNIFQLTIAAAIATTIQLAMRWQHSEAARIEAEAAHAEAELKNLRWQMNPHFMLNTLNNIYALTAIDTQRAQQAIQQLSLLLRHVLYDNQQPMVPLADEVLFMQNYVELMKIRLPKSVDVQFYISPTPSAISSQSYVAPLLFISLVENAFKHGVSPTKKSFIHISISTDGRSIVCDIRNSNHPKNKNDHSGHGIGLQQVRRRLNLAYSGRYEWNYGTTNDGKEYQSTITVFHV